MIFRQPGTLLLLLSPLLGWAAPAKPAQETETDFSDFYDAGQALFEAYAPDEIKAQYEFPSRERWDAFANGLQHALDQNQLDTLARYEPEARVALEALRTLPGYEDYANWLEERLDYIEAARQSTRPAPQPPTPPSPTTPTVPGETPPAPVIPHLDLWLGRLQDRPVPANALRLLPRVRPVFVAAGLPGEFAWLAEAESTFNPLARSPVGARGLFQLMPPTARQLGLSTSWPDERTDPEKSAAAAARYLRQLHARFGDWPLVFAAYNAGPGRVQRTLDQQGGKTFSDIAEHLPAETRMYVPKVLATLQVRAGLTLADLVR